MLNYSLPHMGFLGGQPVSYLASPPISHAGSPPVTFYGSGGEPFGDGGPFGGGGPFSGGGAFGCGDPFVVHHGYYQPAQPGHPAAPPAGSRDSLASSSWAAEVEEAVSPPPSYASLMSRSLQSRSPATPTTPPTPYTPASRDGCCDQDDSFFPASGRLPAYTIRRADLQPGDVWDSHCHLDFLARKLAREGTRHGERLEVSLRLDGENLGERFGGCVANFCDPRDWAHGQQGQDTAQVLRSCRDQPRVFLAVGCHPHFADRLDDVRLLQLERLAGRLTGRLVAIGECGLDRSKKNYIPMETQTKSFTMQVQLALKLRLPLVLHIREAEEEGRAVLREQEVPADWPMHRHCFNDTWAVAEAWLRLYPGSKIGLTGLVTYGHAKAVHEVARRIPLDRLLLETDAPYFLPAGVGKTSYRHRFAQPGHVVHVAAQVAFSVNF
jgi:TatD DNase family protein